MKIYRRLNKEIIETLQTGGVAVIPTDTIYGIVGNALNQKTVRRIYKLRKRNQKKPMIILIGSMDDLKKFGVALTPSGYSLLAKLWPSSAKLQRGKPGAVSVILPLSVKRRVLRDKLRYLHRGTNTLAFRLPKPYWLRRLVANTGPLVAPSANHEGKPPAKTIKEAKHYFKNGVNAYIDKGRLTAKPSRLVRIHRGKIEILR